MIPKAKKKITAFLVGEEGKISKKAILTIGSILGLAAASKTVRSDDCPCHSNGIGLSTTDSTTMATGTHAHAATLHSHHDSGHDNCGCRVK